MRKILVLSTIAAACIALVFVAHKIIVKESSPVSVKWRFETFFYCSPVVASDRIYVCYVDLQGFQENCLYAINRDSGELEWEYCEDDAQFTSPSVVDGVMYTRKLSENPDDKNYLYAIDKASGALKWHFELGDATGSCSTPTVVEGIAYVKSTDYLLCAVDAQNGELLWQFETEEFILSSAPAAANGVVCITTDNYLYAIEAQNGELKWRYEMNCSSKSSPAMSDNAVYMGTSDGRLYSIDIVSGEKRWEYKCKNYGTGFIIKAPPSVVNGVVFFGVSYGVSYSAIYAIGADSGELKWCYETESVLNTATTVVKDVVYIAVQDIDKHLFILHAIDAHTGTLKWKYTVEGLNLETSTIAVVEDTMYVGISVVTNKGIEKHIYALEINTDDQ